MTEANEFSSWLNLRFLDFESRKRKRVTLTEWAQHLGFSAAVVSNWMHGHRTPDSRSVDKLAKKLGQEVYSVLGIVPPTGAARRLLQISNYLSDEDVDQLIRIAEGLYDSRVKTKPGPQ